MDRRSKFGYGFLLLPLERGSNRLSGEYGQAPVIGSGWKRTTSPMEADSMWLNGARWGGVGRVCLRVSYVTKNIAANDAGKFINPQRTRR